MGLEATCICRIDHVTAEAKVFLEATELIIRAPFRRTFKIQDLTDVQTAGDELRFQAGTSAVTIQLGAGLAAKWIKKVTSPAPSLAHKLGIGHASPAFVLGKIEEPKLLEALEGHMANAEAAALSLAVVRRYAELEAALAAHVALKPGSPIWIVHAKGKAATFGEATIRNHMRKRGFRDTKVSSVSDELTAIRYSRG